MKHYLITLLAVLSMTATISAQKCIKFNKLWQYAQTLQVDSSIPLDFDNGLVLERTLTFPDKCQGEIYDVVSNWVETNYDNTTDSTVSIVNLTSSNISATGHIGYLLNKKDKEEEGINIKPELIIEIADGILTIKQHIPTYEYWYSKEKGYKVNLVFYRYNQHKSIKTTSYTRIFLCYPFTNDDKFFKNKEDAINALKICVAYENKIVEEIESAFKNSK